MTISKKATQTLDAPVQGPGLVAQIKKRGSLIGLITLLIWQSAEKVWDTYTDLPARVDAHAKLLGDMADTMTRITEDINDLTELIKQAREDNQR